MWLPCGVGETESPLSLRVRMYRQEAAVLLPELRHPYYDGSRVLPKESHDSLRDRSSALLLAPRVGRLKSPSVVLCLGLEGIAVTSPCMAVIATRGE